MRKLAWADASSSHKPWLHAVKGKRLALRAVDVDVSGAVHRKSSKCASDGTSQSQFAVGIKKEEYPFTGRVTLAGVPQAGPLTDRENLSGANALNGLVHTKADLRECNRVFTSGRSLTLVVSGAY